VKVPGRVYVPNLSQSQSHRPRIIDRLNRRNKIFTALFEQLLHIIAGLFGRPESRNTLVENFPSMTSSLHGVNNGGNRLIAIIQLYECCCWRRHRCWRNRHEGKKLWWRADRSPKFRAGIKGSCADTLQFLIQTAICLAHARESSFPEDSEVGQSRSCDHFLHRHMFFCIWKFSYFPTGVAPDARGSCGFKAWPGGSQRDVRWRGKL